MYYETHHPAYSHNRTVSRIVKTLDRDVERGEDILMSGLGLVVLSTFSAPFFGPTELLPMIALIFSLTSAFAHRHFHKMQRRYIASVQCLNASDSRVLTAITLTFIELTEQSLLDQFNPLKNQTRVYRSLIGAILINPLWFAIFYMLGIQLAEEKKLARLNQAIYAVENRAAFNVVVFV